MKADELAMAAGPAESATAYLLARNGVSVLDNCNEEIIKYFIDILNKL